MASRNQKAPEVKPVDVNEEHKLLLNNLQNLQMKLAAKFKAEEKQTVNISPMYQPYFGRNMPVIINGIAIYIPCNGKGYEIPKTFAQVVVQRIHDVDKQIQLASKLSDVQANFEEYAGQRDLISLA